MRTILSIIITVLVMGMTVESKAQEKKPSINLEVEPVPYIFNGAGMTGAYQQGAWIYSVEAYGMTIPESIHGNQEFDASQMGIGLQFERFLTGMEGFYAGPEISVTTLELTHKSSGNTKDHFNYTAGVRAGYHWNTGLGNLYLNPVAGLSYAFHSHDIEINNATYENGPVTPWATIGIGWSFNSILN